ncbi:hypothetical protein M8J77_012004 [Diaphorina citri]|nr:hypothetical protein M8J77_012004 [Diaphorina citri]
MFGLKIRSWMETHLVRSRKKRNKDGGGKIKQEKSPPDHIAVVNNEFEYKSAKCIDNGKKISPISTIKTQTSLTEHSSSSLKAQSPFTCVVNLSSPESAYSTGYSTDGTSPGASLPPEYYINIRTGTHYFQSNRVEKLTPRSARRKKDEAKRKKHGEVNGVKHLPESSTEDEILNADSTTEERLPTHRRTESCDENNLSAISSPPSSSPYLPGASPRPRNRIRTNPWLPCSPGGSVVKLTTDSSAVDSSSTVSSTSCREKHVSPHKKLASPRKKPKEIGSKVSSPIVSRRSKDAAITTCSPLSARHCPHLRPGGSSSSPLSSSDDDNHGNTSDFSDDDVTLNEMLGKYDESYTYEKETDILSDSDLTDVDDKNMNLEFVRRDVRDDFDFIDNGSSVAHSENNSPMPGKKMNTGHCYYHLMGERLLKQKSIDSRSSSRSSSIVKRSKKSESERRRKSRNPSQEKIICQFKPCSPIPKNEKHFNMNKILVERLNQTQDRGTQSANTTPLSARKRLTENGKYLKNDYITNLINSNLSLCEKNQNSYGNISNERKFSLNMNNSGSLEELQQKKRSNSLSQEIIPIEPEDLKYKKLTEEANYIIEKLESCKLNSANRRVSSAQNSPVRSNPTDRNISNFLETPSSPRHMSPIRHNSHDDIKTKPDFDNRNNSNHIVDSAAKCWSPLKMKLLKQSQNHQLNNRGSQNINLNSASSPVKHFPLYGKQLNSGIDNAGSPKFTRNLNIHEQNQEVLNRNERNVNLDFRNNNEATDEPRDRNIYAIPYEHIVSNKPQNVAIKLRDGNHIKKNMVHDNAVINSNSPLHHRYNGEPTYENINMTTFSRQSTATFSQLAQRDHIIGIEQTPPKIPINTQTYKLAKSKYNAPPSPLSSQNHTKPTLTTFQKPSAISTSYHTRSTADILTDSKAKPTLPSNFKSLYLGPNNSDLYCPRSEPVKRKVYTCSVSYGKLQKSLKGGNFLRDSETCNQLRNSVAQLRKERFYVEAKLRKTQQQINKIKNDF